MKKFKKTLTILATAIISTTAFAAEQGSLVHGDKNINSTGKFDVRLSVKNAIQINNLKDIDLGSFESGSTTQSAKSQSEDFCVFTNATSFSLNIAGGHSSGFALAETNDSSLFIPYVVEVATKDVSDNATTWQSVAHNQTLNGISETRNRKNCLVVDGANTATKNNMLIQVSLSENDMLDAIPGDYKDTITLVASPE